MSNSIFDQFRMTAIEKQLGVYGVALYQKGKPILTHRLRADERVCLFSCSKTFTSIAAGICQDEGRIKLSDKVLDIFPEYKPIASEKTDTITIRDLLHMACGKSLPWSGFGSRNAIDGDYAELFFRQPVTGVIGETYEYSNACSYMLSRIIEQVSGSNMRDYLMPRLFDLLKIPNPQWHTCHMGHTLGGTELYLKTDELLRLGIMLLSTGVYDEQRVVSEAYIGAATTDIIDTAPFMSLDNEQKKGYGYHLWICERDNTYRADGLYGQFLVMMKDKDAAVAVTAHNEGNTFEILRAIYKDIGEKL